MYYIIYKTTNLINGMFYIGKHKTKNLNDTYVGSGKLLKKAIKKYGLENFYREVLHICKNERHMNILENILVVPDREINYNLCSGGNGGFSYINRELASKMRNVRVKNIKNAHNKASVLKATKHSSETMKRTHAQGKIRHDTFKGKKHTDEWKQALSFIMKEKSKGVNNSQYGTCWVTDGSNNKKIKKEDISIWIEKGYRKGRVIV